LVFVLCLASASSIQWVKLGEPAEIKCTAVGEVQSCSWKTPTMERPRWKLEEERMNITKSGKDCIVRIEKTQKEDEGSWECLVQSNTDDGFSAMEEEKKSVKIAEFPKNEPVIDASPTGENDTETNYTCKYENSKPLPSFTWYIDEEEIASEGERLTIQRADYANQTLKCEVDFKKHGLTDTFSAQLLIDQENLENSDFESPEDTPDTMSSYTKTIIAVVSAMFGVCLLVVVLYLVGCLRNPRKSDDTDAETGTSDSLPMKESTETEKSDNETEKADSTKDEKEKLTEAVKGTFGDRLASFFRINKSFNMDDEKTDNAGEKTNDDELQKVVIDNSVDNKEENGDDLDKPDSKTSLSTVSLATDKAECNGDGQTEEPVVAKSKKANGGNKLIAVFAKMFKPRSDAVADKGVPDEETLVKIPDEDQEQNKVEETEPLTDELEPEDKAEPVEKEDDKKEPTPNTSF